MNEILYRIGYDVLGPVFATFARLLLDEAHRDGVTRLAFIARDGEFLRDVTARFAARLQLRNAAALEYVHLSRVATILPQYSRFRDAVLAESDGIFGERYVDVAAFLRYFGVDPAELTHVLKRHDFSPATPLTSSADLAPLLNDSSFLDAMEIQRLRQKRLLEQYLEQTHVLSDPACALVDLGWRGSIPAAIAATFSDRLPRGTLRAYNLAYWDERGSRGIPHCEMKGLISDHRQSRTPVGGSAFYAAYILEAVCRAPHGTTLGFARDGGGAVVPILAGDSPQREIERAGEEWREPIRRAVYDFIESEGPRVRDSDAQNLRRDAQRRLFRLAVFPTRAEIEAVARLAHTEGYTPGLARPLLDAARPSPLFSPRRWLAGLASPWRSGYVMATGGRPLAIVFTAFESLLLTFPSVRRVARSAALALARIRR